MTRWLTYGFATLLMLASSFSYAETRLAYVEYQGLEPGRSYTTGALAINPGPSYVSTIRLDLYGQNCNLTGKGFFARRVRDGKWVQGVFRMIGNIPTWSVNERISHIELKFMQNVSGFTVCRFSFWNLAGSDSDNTGDLLENTKDLATDSKLLRTIIDLTPAYESVKQPVERVRDYADYLASAVASGHDYSELKTIYGLLLQANKQLEDVFYPVHISVRDRNVEDAWSAYRASLAKVQLD